MAVDRAFETQQRIIWNAAHNRDFADKAFGLVVSDDFREPCFKLVWHALQTMWIQERKLADGDTLTMRVLDILDGADPLFKIVIPPEQEDALVDFIAAVMDPGNAGGAVYLAEKLPDFIYRGRVTAIVDKHKKTLSSTAPDAFIEELLAARKATSSATGIKISTLSDDLGLFETEDDIVRMSTGVPKIDRYMDGGLSPTEVAMITAAPGIGKSNGLLNMSASAAEQHQKNLLITLELPEKKMRARYSAMAARIRANLTKQVTSAWPAKELARVRALATEAYIGHNMTSFADLSTKRHKVSAVESAIERWKDTLSSPEDAKLVVIDWVDMLDGVVTPGKDTKDWMRVAEILYEFKYIAKRQNVGIWTATQGTRDAIKDTVLDMTHVSGGFHKNDALDYSLGFGLDDDSKLTRKNMEEKAGKQDEDRKFICSFMKNRNNSLGAFPVYRAPDLRLYDDEVAYKRIIARL